MCRDEDWWICKRLSRTCKSKDILINSLKVMAFSYPIKAETKSHKQPTLNNMRDFANGHR
jgi:hypothetical protein